MIIYIIRHAQTVHNKKGKVFSGVSDIALSPEGEKEALKCRELDFLKNVKKVYISPLKRTKQTADLIFGESITKEVVPEFSEMDFGDYEGRILNEENTEDEVFKKWLTDPEKLKFPNGDDFSTHAHEAFEAFVRTIGSEKENIIAIVSHRTTIRLILTQILGKELNTFREIPCDNCSVTKVRFEGEIFHIEERI